MAFLQNPNYGIVPGAPQGLSWWDGNTFRMSGMPPPPVAPLPPVATAATPTTGAGGAQPGGGGPGTGPGGVGGGGQDTTTSGYPGVYAQAPGELNSQFGNVMGTAGMGVPYPGAGTALGALGGFIDASRYNGINAQYGVPGTVNPWGSAAHEILSGIGVPFTDWDLAALFDVPSARARHLGLVDDAGYIGRDAMGYGALAANQPVGPVTRESGQFASYPAGFIESGLQPSHGLPAEQAAQLNLDVERTINANPDVFGVGPAGGGPTPGGDYGNIDVSPGPGPDQGGYGPGAGAGPGAGGAYGPGWAKGGLVGPPPGRYERGGRVRSPTTGEMIDPAAPPALTIRRDPLPPPAPRQEYDTTPIPLWQQILMGVFGPSAPGGGVPSERRVPREAPGRYAAGGAVRVPDANITPAQFGLLRGIDPPGPDDQIGALQSGEGVLTRATMRKYPGLLDAANAGKIPAKKLTGLLAVAPVKARRR